jgi:hypothetical protein
MNISPSTIGLLEDMVGSPKIYKESLIYNAGASLYDALRYQTEGLIPREVHPLIEEMKLLEAFNAAPKSVWRDTWAAAHLWMQRNVTEEVYQNFSKSFNTNESHLPRPIDIYIPIICVDAPLYEATVDEQGDIQEIIPVSKLFTTLRLPRWPGAFRYNLIYAFAEAPLWVVHVEALDTLLNSFASWFDELRQSLDDAFYLCDYW